jgi:isopentenyl phosphate kinase
MVKVKTFGEPLQIFRVRRELDELDQQVNEFIAKNGIKKVISVSDSPTTENGTVIGLIRVLVYED